MKKLSCYIPFLLVLGGALFFLWNFASGLKKETPIQFSKIADSEYDVTKMHPFVLVVYLENPAHYEKNLLSALRQEYSNYRVIYVNSPLTHPMIDTTLWWLTKENAEERVTFVASMKEALSLCKDEEIVVFLHGQHALAHEKVLRWLNQCYNDSTVWMTYGSSVEYPSYKKSRGNKEIPYEVMKTGDYRSLFIRRELPLGLITGYAGLFKHIPCEQEIDSLQTFEITLMLPAFEMAREHAHFIRDILCICSLEKKASLEKEALFFPAIYDPIAHWSFIEVKGEKAG